MCLKLGFCRVWLSRIALLNFCETSIGIIFLSYVYPSCCQHFIWQLFCASWHLGLSSRITWLFSPPGWLLPDFCSVSIYDFKFSIADFLFTKFYVTPGYNTDTTFQHFSLITVNLGSCYVGSFMLMACSYGSEHGTDLRRKDSGDYRHLPICWDTNL